MKINKQPPSVSVCVCARAKQYPYSISDERNNGTGRRPTTTKTVWKIFDFVAGTVVSYYYYYHKEAYRYGPLSSCCFLCFVAEALL